MTLKKAAFPAPRSVSPPIFPPSAALGTLLCLALASPAAHALPVDLPGYSGGVVLIDTHGPGPVPGTSHAFTLPTVVPPGLAFLPVFGAPHFRQYAFTATDGCVVTGGGAVFVCAAPDLLNSPAPQHWELELQNLSSSPTGFNFVQFAGAAAAAFVVGLGAGSTILFDFLVPDTLTEINTLFPAVRSSVPTPIAVAYAITEGGTPAPGSPTLAPCPAITVFPCTYAFFSSPDDFILAGNDPALPTIWFNRPEDNALFPTPEPPATALLLAGLIGALAARRVGAGRRHSGS